MNLIIKKLVSCFWLNLFCIILSLQASALNCSNGLTNSFAVATLKAAKFLNENSLKTLEDYARVRSTRLNVNELKMFKKSFERFAISSSFNGFVKSLKGARYWSNETRLVNASSAMVLVLINQLEGAIFTDEDIYTLWALQHINFIDSDNTSVFNFSNNVVKLTGALKGHGILSISKSKDLLAKFNEDCKSTKLTLKELYSSLYESPESLFIRGSDLLYKNNIILKNISFSNYISKEIVKGFESKETRLGLRGSAEFERNELSSLDVINFYHQNYDINDYLIIDKGHGLVSLMREGQMIQQQKVAFDSNDKKAIGGAGIYEIDVDGNLFSEDGSYFKKISLEFDLIKGSKVYILPTDKKKHDFIFKNHRISFNALKTIPNYYAFNYSPRDHYYIETNFNLVANKTEFKEDFLKALSNEKENLMRLYKMDSNTYNELALFSYGVLSLESKFGESIKYKIKQTLPIVVAIAKGNGIDMSENSSGPSQIKVIPKTIEKFYKIDKSDLSSAHHSAVATLGFSYELLLDLKRLAKYHSEINFRNIYDYLYYLYQGNRAEITNASATPEKSIRIKMIKKAAKEVKVVDLF